MRLCCRFCRCLFGKWTCVYRRNGAWCMWVEYQQLGKLVISKTFSPNLVALSELVFIWETPSKLRLMSRSTPSLSYFSKTLILCFQSRMNGPQSKHDSLVGVLLLGCILRLTTAAHFMLAVITTVLWRSVMPRKPLQLWKVSCSLSWHRLLWAVRFRADK